MIQHIISVVYFVVGVIVANGYGYFTDIGSLQSILSAVLAVFLWPLLFVGVNLHLMF
jgi:hypothetical protein